MIRPLRAKLPWMAGAAALATFSAMYAITIPVGARATEGGPGRRSRPAKHAPSAASAVNPITTPVRLTYGYRVGDVRRYKVTAYFTGHIPPVFVAPNPAGHIVTILDYVATVKKVTDKGTEVEFKIENGYLGIMEKEPAEGAKFNPEKDAVEYPIPLTQVQNLFNATATFKPNGAIASIQGGDTSPIKVDVGFDLRKLFLVTAPVMFADKPVKAGEEWTFDDGLLGTKPGKTTYTGRLQSIAGSGKSVTATVYQQADSNVESKLDKEGNSTNDAAAAVGTLVGKVKLTGTAQVVGTTETAPTGAGASGRVTTARMAMVVDLTRTLPDPEHAGQQQVTPIDVKARLYVEPTQKAAAPTKWDVSAEAATHAKDGKKATAVKTAKRK